MQTAVTQPAVLTFDVALCAVLGRVRDRARLRHGPLARRVRRTGGRRRHVLRRRARGRRGARARDDPRRASTTTAGWRPSWRPSKWSRRRWARSTATWSPPTSTAAASACIGGASAGGRGGHRGLPEAGLPGHAASGEPRLPHQDRGARRCVAARGARSTSTSRRRVGRWWPT